jgi:hypothetical protein
MYFGLKAHIEVSKESLQSETILTAMMAGTPWTPSTKEVETNLRTHLDGEVELVFESEDEIHDTKHAIVIHPHEKMHHRGVIYAVQHYYPDQERPPDRLEDCDTLYDAMSLVIKNMESIEESDTLHGKVIA